MRAIIPGHVYELDNLKADTKSNFKFHMDPDIHDGMALDGPSCQEVIRMVVDRTKLLDSEKPWQGNEEILAHLRSAIVLFEARAMLRKVEKGNLDVEGLPLDADGHLKLGS